MVKRAGLFSFALVLAIAVLCSCRNSNSVSVTSGYSEDGVFYIDMEGHHSESPKSLPYSLAYNGKQVVLDSVDAYEVQGEDYAHTLYIVTTITAADLTDEEFHWLISEDLDICTYITCEANEYDFSGAYLLGKCTDSDRKQITVVHISSPYDNCRYSFANSNISVSIQCSQKETYDWESEDGKTYKHHKINELIYRFAAPSNIQNAETIPEPIYSTIVKWLSEKAR